MTGAHLAAVGAASVAAFVASSAWYALLGDRTAALRSASAANQVASDHTDIDSGPEAASATPEPWKIAVELLRSATVATVLAWALDAMDIAGVGQAVPAAAVVWAAFPVVLLTGSVIWEDEPWQLAAIHAGDWLVKLALIAAIVTAWPA